MSESARLCVRRWWRSKRVRTKCCFLGRYTGAIRNEETLFSYRMEQCDPGLPIRDALNTERKRRAHFAAGCMVELVIQLFIIFVGKQTLTVLWKF